VTLAPPARRIACVLMRRARRLRWRRLALLVESENLPLNTPLAGIFYCRRCRARVAVTLESPV